LGSAAYQLIPVNAGCKYAPGEDVKVSYDTAVQISEAVEVEMLLQPSADQTLCSHGVVGADSGCQPAHTRAFTVLITFRTNHWYLAGHDLLLFGT
jgi:hypothetical protein